MIEQRKRVLIVDDEPGVRESLRLLLKDRYEIALAEDGDQALSSMDQLKPDLVILDLIMPKIDGIEALKQIKEKRADLPVIILTGTNTVRTAVQAMKLGAVDYLGKPFEVDELKGIIAKAIEGQEQQASAKSDSVISKIRGAADVEADFGPMVGRSSCMQDLFSRVRQVAERETTVLITGESGTGKELIARMIHRESKRKDGPFIPINCAAIPESLIESELFGHEKGAFTHAVERRIGHCELANKGTLFLDEIGELSLGVQVKILRFLQEQEFYRVGRSKPINVDVRIIAATNRNLEQAIKQKQFREDLYYRINVIGLHIPPLRDRFEDIQNLVEHFCSNMSSIYGGKKLTFHPDAMRILVEYPWPGNVRELENVVESLIALCPNEQVLETDLPEKLKVRATFEGLKNEANSGQLGFDEAERQFEREIILKALRKTNFIQTRAAEVLGISRRILKYKMDKLGISDKAGDEGKLMDKVIGADNDPEKQTESAGKQVPLA